MVANIFILSNTCFAFDVYFAGKEEHKDLKVLE
jgi:hypothetical protein